MWPLAAGCGEDARERSDITSTCDYQIKCTEQYTPLDGYTSLFLLQSAVKISLMSIHNLIYYLHNTLILYPKQNYDVREKSYALDTKG
jgi:hypothetical protein